MARKILFLFSIILIISTLLFFSKKSNGESEISNEKIVVFKGISGPDRPTTIPRPNHKSYKLYSNGSKNRLAIYLTDESSSWLALAHGLKSIGIPFRSFLVEVMGTLLMVVNCC